MKLISIYLILINVTAFLAYGLDKWKAQNDKWRIPEKTLLLLAALGGSLGALAGMRLFHHKTKHRKFTIGIPVIILLQAVLVYFLFLR